MSTQESMVGGFSKIPEAHPGESARRIFMGYDDGELWKTNMCFVNLLVCF